MQAGARGISCEPTKGICGVPNIESLDTETTEYNIVPSV